MRGMKREEFNHGGHGEHGEGKKRERGTNNAPPSACPLPSQGNSMYSVTLVIAEIRRQRRTVRGCQNIMGFFDRADQGTKAKTRCTV
jgi:hypothetical protein